MVCAKAPKEKGCLDSILRARRQRRRGRDVKQLAEESNGLVSQYSCRDGQKDFFRSPALSLGSDRKRDNKGALRHGLGRVRASLQISDY